MTAAFEGGMHTAEMKTVIVGPGAMGCLWAAYLKQGGMDVTLLDYRKERARTLMNQGIRVRGVREDMCVKVPVVADPGGLGKVDLLIFMVKAYHTESAVRMHLNAVGDDTTVLSVQNGIGNIETILEFVARKQVIAGSTTMGANRGSDLSIRHAGEGRTYIGELDSPSSERIVKIARYLSEAGIQVEVRADIQYVIWNKLLINLGINALTALLAVKNGVLTKHEPIREMMRLVIEEGVRAAQTQGHEFQVDEVYQLVCEVSERTGQNLSSMLQDVRAARPTEIDSINGAVCRMVPAPYNRMLTLLIQAIEATPHVRQS